MSVRELANANSERNVGLIHVVGQHLNTFLLFIFTANDGRLQTNSLANPIKSTLQHILFKHNVRYDREFR